MFPCRESIISLKRKYLKTEAEEGLCLSQPSMDGILDAIAKEGCSSLLEEVFLDLEVSLAPPPSSTPGARAWGRAWGLGGFHVLLWTTLLPSSCSC